MKPANPLFRSLLVTCLAINMLSFSVVSLADAPKKLTELVVVDVKVGTGIEAVGDVDEGDTLEVHYTGWIYDPKKEDRKGREFESSRDKGKNPFTFKLGMGKVIKGWDKGLEGMKVGGQRTLIIPADMAYGKDGMENKTTSIPANVPLVFDVELLNVTKP
jgi:FKBP-type peptidyl-prolyl cis-trans isomerase FkpA